MKTNKYNNKLNFLGPVIRDKRKKLKMSQNMLALNLQLEGINIGKNDISKIESQNRIIKDYELIALKNILYIDLNNLYLK